MTVIRDMLAAADQRPAFISVKAGRLLLTDHSYDQLVVRILEFVVVRKHFVDQQLHCYSLDLRQGSKGAYCSFCPVRQRCQKRLRLLLVVIDDEQDTPAILEINHRSVGSLDDMVERIGREQLADTLVRIDAAVVADGYSAVEFRELF